MLDGKSCGSCHAREVSYPTVIANILKLSGGRQDAARADNKWFPMLCSIGYDVIRGTVWVHSDNGIVVTWG